jgi:uracil DNA glycosylase superfamily protein
MKNFMSRSVCPNCGEDGVRPSGNVLSKVLVVGEFPGRAEMERGIPFATHNMYTTAGKVFRKELNRVGLDLNRWRVMNLWVHEPNPKDKQHYENCYKVGYDMVLDEAKGRSAILLVGSDVVEEFTGYSVMDVSGLQVESAVLSCPIIYAMVNPALALHRSVGEVRLAIEKFAKRLEMEGIV